MSAKCRKMFGYQTEMFENISVLYCMFYRGYYQEDRNLLFTARFAPAQKRRGIKKMDRNTLYTNTSTLYSDVS
jgi:hypothetical protein